MYDGKLIGLFWRFVLTQSRMLLANQLWAEWTLIDLRSVEVSSPSTELCQTPDGVWVYPHTVPKSNVSPRSDWAGADGIIAV